MLDALLEDVVSRKSSSRIGRQRLTRWDRCPEQGIIPFAISRRDLAGWRVPCCSSPILGRVIAERVEHFTKRFATEAAALLHPSQRGIVATTNGDLKSYRLPLRVRTVDALHWICLANYRELRKQCRAITSLGRKRSIGYGRVRDWTFAAYDADHWWYADKVLMRPLPVGRHLPIGLTGAKQDYGACVPPYWHPERYTEIVTPC